MQYVVGSVLPLGVGLFSALVGFDRDRSFFPVVLIVIANLYVVFATMAPSGHPLGPELAGAALFVTLAVVGFKWNLWVVAAGTVGHGLFDFVHHRAIDNPGVPAFWPGFCGAFDVVFGAWIAFRLLKGGLAARAREESTTS